MIDPQTLSGHAPNTQPSDSSLSSFSPVTGENGLIELQLMEFYLGDSGAENYSTCDYCTRRATSSTAHPLSGLRPTRSARSRMWPSGPSTNRTSRKKVKLVCMMLPTQYGI